jgi:long-chain acyl-CoA synthetase
MTIPELLEQQARTFGAKNFVLCDDQTHSYQAIHEGATRVAENLARSGVGRGDKVVILTGNCMEFIYLYLGLGRIGAVLVPVNPTLKPEEIAYIVHNSDAETIVMVSEFLPFLPVLRQKLPQVKRLFVVGDGADGVAPFASLLEPIESARPVQATRDDDAALIYTSGTTGVPKGVMLSHRNYLADAAAMAHQVSMSPDDRFFCVLPLFHVNAQVVTVLAPLTVGGDVLLMTKFNPFAILPMIQTYRPTILSAVPTIYNIMCRMPKADEYDVSSIRFFASGAAPLPEETYQATQRVLKRPLIMGYGLSEATCASTAADYRDPIKWDSVGPPLRYTGIRIADDEGRDVPVGEIGEILISGPCVMKGYYKNPEATAEVLKDGWLYTGDLGRMDEDGYLFIVGRKKDMIIRGGLNVYPQQIENVISRLPGVEECCVVGVDEPRWGQEILALIKPLEGENVHEDAVHRACKEELAPYKQPRFIRFVETFPKTATGKIKKGEVAQQFAEIATGARGAAPAAEHA